MYALPIVVFVLIILTEVYADHLPIVRKRTSNSLKSQCISPTTNNDSILSSGNCNNYMYYIEISIGTPSQTFLFQFDTGSEILWVPTITTNPQGFNISASVTYSNLSQPYSIEYADESKVSGYMGEDIVIIPNTPIHIKEELLFVNKETSITFSGNVIGITGMGYSTQSNFLDIAYQNGQISTNQFSLQLLPTNNQSYIYYNNIPSYILTESLYSDVNTPLQFTSFWQLELIGMYADSNDLTSSAASSVVIDSGTSLFYLNPSLFQAINASYMTNCHYLSLTGFYYCPCNNTMPTLYFMFPGVKIQIEPSNYVFNINSTVCEVQLNTLSTETSEILLGDTLFMNYIITFSKNEGNVGFYGNTEEVSGLGKGDNGFVISQWIMMSILIVLTLWALISVIMLRSANLGELSKPLNSSRESGLEMRNVQQVPHNIYTFQPSNVYGQKANVRVV